MDTVELENKRLLKDKPEGSNIDDESWIRFYRVVDNLRMLDHLLKINEKEHNVESSSHDIPLPPEDDDYSNLNPSCRRCNHYKRSAEIETFRNMIEQIPVKLGKEYIYKVGIDYGFYNDTPKKVKFYFER